MDIYSSTVTPSPESEGASWHRWQSCEDREVLAYLADCEAAHMRRVSALRSEVLA